MMYLTYQIANLVCLNDNPIKRCQPVSVHMYVSPYECPSVHAVIIVTRRTQGKKLKLFWVLALLQVIMTSHNVHSALLNFK